MTRPDRPEHLRPGIGVVGAAGRARRLGRASAQLASLVERTVARFGRVDGLVISSPLRP